MSYEAVEARLQSGVARLIRMKQRLSRKNIAFEAGLSYAYLQRYLWLYPHLADRLGLAEAESINNDRDALACRDAIFVLIRKGIKPTYQSIAKIVPFSFTRVAQLCVLYPGLLELCKRGKEYVPSSVWRADGGVPR